MRWSFRHGMLAVVGLSLALFIGLIASGCDSPSPMQMSSTASAGASSQPDSSAQASAHPAKSGAELWSQTCGRCHNLRSPSEFSPNQWAVVVHHMRIRANLTGEEARIIKEYLMAR